MPAPVIEQAAALRWVLGCAQMFGASLGLILLWKDGLTPAAVGVAAGTSLLTALSRRLFRRRDVR